MGIIEVDNLRKTYGSLVAVDNISFQVFRGEIFGMVGPNGAGKTTTIECIEGLRKPDGGRIRVLGLDPIEDNTALLERIGIQLQESELPDNIRVKEAIELFASFYDNPVPCKQLLEKLGLTGMENVYFRNLSGGQKKRLFIGLALIGNPEVVFLDELTTGLDPQGRRAMWDLVRDIRDKGKTIFMTTHYMEDAERLCDRVAIIDHGRIIALDSPGSLVRKLGTEKRVTFTVANKISLESIRALPNVTRVEQIGKKIIVYGESDELLANLVKTIEKHGWSVKDLRQEQSALEDVFLLLTGRELRD